MSYPFEYGHVQRALLMTSCMTIVMSQLNLSDETLVFYRMLKSVTIGGVTLITLAHMLTTYHASEMAAAEKLKEVPQRLIAAAKEAREQEAKASVSISRLPVWEDDGSHPSHVLTTVDAKPRLFPFPLGKASADGPNLYFESGLAPKIGDFSKGRGEAYQTRLAAAQKSQDDEGSIQSKRTEAIRKYEYQQRRKQWKRRLAHLKALCIVIIVAYINQKMALVALAVLIWKTLNAELARLSQAPLGKDPHEEFAARFGTRTVGRKRPYGAGIDNETPSNIGMTYLYQPDAEEKRGLAPLAEVPLRGPIRPLLTTTDDRFAGRMALVGDAEKEGINSSRFGKGAGSRGKGGEMGGSASDGGSTP